MNQPCAAVLAGLQLVATTACMTAPPPAPPRISFEQKMAWILRLEDQRVLRDPAPPGPAVPAPTSRTGQAVTLPPPVPDLTRLLADEEARVRRRAALAIGRVGLAEGVEALVSRLSDAEPEVRQMAAFALGLLAGRKAIGPLEAALADPSPVVQGRAAEALGRIGEPQAAAAIADMAARQIQAGALEGIAEDEMGYPLDPRTEAVRLSLYALARLKAYDALARIVVDRSGQPVSGWWPVAYALAETGDPRALPALLVLARAGSPYTRVFAAQGLGALKDPAAVDPLVALSQGWLTAPAPAAAAVRALGRVGDARAVKPLLQMLTVRELAPNVQLEVVRTLGALGAREAGEMLLDLVTDPWPSMRAAALGALSAIDQKMFLLVLSGLDPDRHWSVRAALAGMLARAGPAVAAARLPALLNDPDRRVVPAVLDAMVQARTPGAAAAALERLDAEDVVVRMAAAQALGALKPEGAADRLASAYARWGSDTTYVARAAALAALAAVDPAGAIPVLERALADPEWAVRVRAADLLAELAPSKETARAIRPASGRPADQYEAPYLVAPPVTPHAYIETDKGTIQIELFVVDAPLAVESFIVLARKGFFEGVPIHRVVPAFVVQDGDPRGDGEGGPGYTLRDENSEQPYLRGTVGMALDWRDTGGSQFFITHGPEPRLDGRYPAFGRVLAGMEVVDRLQQWDTIRRVRVWEGVEAGR